MNRELSYFLIVLLSILFINYLYNRETLTNNTTLFSINPTTGEIEFEEARDVYSYVDDKIAEIDTSVQGLTLSDLDAKIQENNTTVQTKIDTDIKVPESRYLIKTDFNTFKNPGGYLHTNFMKKSNPYYVTVTETGGVSKYTFRDGTEETAEERTERIEEEVAAAAAQQAATQQAATEAAAAATTQQAQRKANFRKYLEQTYKYIYPFGKVRVSTHSNPAIPTEDEVNTEFNKLSTSEKQRYNNEVDWGSDAEKDNTRRKHVYIWYLYSMYKIVNPGRTYADFFNNNDTIKHINNHWGGAGKSTYKLRGDQLYINREGTGPSIAKIDVQEYIGSRSTKERAETRFKNYKDLESSKIDVKWEISNGRPDSIGGPVGLGGEFYDTLSRYMTLKEQAEYDNEKTLAADFRVSDEVAKVKYMYVEWYNVKRKEKDYDEFTSGITFSEFIKPGGEFYTKKKLGNTLNDWWRISNRNTSWRKKYHDPNWNFSQTIDYWAQISLANILKFEYSDEYLKRKSGTERGTMISKFTATDPLFSYIKDPANIAIKEYLASVSIPVLEVGTQHQTERDRHKDKVGNWVYNLINNIRFKRGRRHFEEYNKERARYRHYWPKADKSSANPFVKIRGERIDKEVVTETAKYNNFTYNEYWPWFDHAKMKYNTPPSGSEDYKQRIRSSKEDERWEILWGRVWKPYFEQNCDHEKANKEKELLEKYLKEWDYMSKDLIDKITYDNKTKLWTSDYLKMDWVKTLIAKGFIPTTRYKAGSACGRVLQINGQTINLNNLNIPRIF